MTTMHNNEQQHTTTRTNKEQSSIKNNQKIEDIKAYTNNENIKHAKH
jgi:hypothetical protein